MHGRLAELLKAYSDDFVGYEDLRYKLIYETPKYGNDDDYADELAVKVFEMFFDAVDGRPNARGGKHHIMMLPTTSHVYFGSVTGRHARWAQSLAAAFGRHFAFPGGRYQRPDSRH